VQLGALHLQGKVVGTFRPQFGNFDQPLTAGDEFAKSKSLDETIRAVKLATAGPGKPGALVVGNAKWGYEAYFLNVTKTAGAKPVPFHFEGLDKQHGAPWPKYTVGEGLLFVDGDTVLRR
jgi:hypothetical protein